MYREGSVEVEFDVNLIFPADDAQEEQDITVRLEGAINGATLGGTLGGFQVQKGSVDVIVGNLKFSFSNFRSNLRLL